jgi:hypothetical protein
VRRECHRGMHKPFPEGPTRMDEKYKIAEGAVDSDKEYDDDDDDDDDDDENGDDDCGTGGRSKDQD